MPFKKFVIFVLLIGLTGCAGMGSRFDPKTLPPDLHWVSVNGIPVVYREEGRGEPVLILTPYPFSTDLWTPLVRLLAPTSHVFVVEPVGLRNPASMKGDFTTEHFLQIYRQFILAVGLNKVHVIGVGESGALAVAFSHHFPQHGLTSVSINGYESITWTRKIGEMLSAFDTTTESGLTALMSKASIRHRVRPPQPEEIRRLVVLPPVELEPEERTDAVHLRMNAYKQDVKGAFVAAMLPSVAYPLLIIRSESDEILPERYAERTQGQIHRAKVREEVIPGAGHFAFLDQPDKVSEAVLKFHSLYPASSNGTAP